MFGGSAFKLHSSVSQIDSSFLGRHQISRSLPKRVMGIRFFCPHCRQRLNVKTGQSGQLGMCTHCDKTVTVPIDSDETQVSSDSLSVRPKELEQSVIGDGSSQLLVVKADLDEDEQDTIGGELAGDPGGIEYVEPPKSMSPVFAVSSSSGSGVFMLDRPSLPPEFGKVCPIADAPKKVWYFRSKLIGERGPLKSKVMQRHLEDGDVTVGCVVWREDWEDWVPAESAFPQLAAIGNSQNFTDASYDVELDRPTTLLSRSATPGKRALFFGAIVAGLSVVGALAYLLIILVNSS